MKQFEVPQMGVTFVPGIDLGAASGGVNGGGPTGEVGSGGQED